MFEDRIDIEQFQAALVRALAGVAGAAGDIQAEDGFVVAVGAGADRVGGAEQGDHRLVQGSRDVHRAGVIADHQRCPFDQGDQLAEGGLSAEIQSACDPIAQPAL